MICPKCGRPVDQGAVICPGCDFILDTEFLGDEILDEEKSLRPGAGGVDPAVFNLADAVILGDIDDQAQSFETSDSGFHVRESTGARLYVSGRSQVVMAPDAVIAVIPDGMKATRLTPFEKHVLSFIDGKRPVEAIRVKAGLDESEVKTALATLADKGVVEVVGRAFADDAFEETAARKRPQRKRRAPIAGAVAAAMGAGTDAADRAIEEAFRTSTGLNPLSGESIEAPPDDGMVFSSLSENPLQSLEDEAPELAEPPAKAEPPGDTGVNEPLRDDDLPSDADSFDVIAHTSEIDLRRIRKAGGGGGSLEPEPTNARRVLSDPELKRLLKPEKEPGSSIHGAPTGTGVREEEAFEADESDGFDDFGDPSQLDTAMLSGAPDSLSVPGQDQSDVFRSGTGSSSLSEIAQPNAEALKNLQRPDESDIEDETGTHTRGELKRRQAQAPDADDEASQSLSQLLDENASPLSSLGDTPALTPALRDTPVDPSATPAAELAEAVGGADALAELLEDSLEGDSVLDESVDASAESDLSSAAVEFVDDEAPAVRAPAAEPSLEPAPTGYDVAVASEDAADSDQGTAVYVENPFDENEDAPASVTTGAVAAESASAHSEIVEFESEGMPSDPRVRPPRGASQLNRDEESELSSELESELDSDDGVSDLYEAETGDVSALQQSRGGAAGELFPDDDGMLPSDQEISEPRRQGSEELISENMIIRPARGAKLRGGSVLDEMRKRGPQPASQERSGNYEREVVVEHPEASGAAQGPPPGEATFVLPDAVDPSVPEGEDVSWDASAATGEVESMSDEASSEATNVLSGRRAQSPSAPELSREMSEPVVQQESTRHDADVMRDKARKLFDDALRDFHEGRVGAARMNAKLATIYDPANEEYRTALEQWGREGASDRHRQPSHPRYAVLYEEAQDREASGDIDGAVELLEAGARSFPDIAAIQNRLGVLLAIHKREYERAAAFIQRAIELDPQNLHYKSNLGKILSKKRQRQRRANG